MSLKRKAAELEDPSLSPEPRVPSLSSSQSSASTNFPAQDETPFNLWNIAGAPYFNSRTRKRFRDGRPSEETIHEQTLKKLFAAQRRQQPDNNPQDGSSSDTAYTAASETPLHLRHHANAELIRGPANQVEVPPERSQRSIQSFFAHVAPDRNNMNTTVHQPPLTASIHQPHEHVPHLVPHHPMTLPSVVTCEDCYSPLLTKNSGEAVDAEMCDVDGGPTAAALLDDLEVDEGGWSCVLCAKRVCDTCAVRGDYRVCLECAVPGGGTYRPEELHEKRWVGGIGWM